MDSFAVQSSCAERALFSESSVLALAASKEAAALEREMDLSGRSA